MIQWKKAKVRIDFSNLLPFCYILASLHNISAWLSPALLHCSLSNGSSIASWYRTLRFDSIHLKSLLTSWSEKYPSLPMLSLNSIVKLLSICRYVLFANVHQDSKIQHHFPKLSVNWMSNGQLINQSRAKIGSEDHSLVSLLKARGSD